MSCWPELRDAESTSAVSPPVMTFYELLWEGEGCGDAADLEEALTNFQELKPKGMTWQEVCADGRYSPTIRRYRSFEAYLDNEDELETLHPSAEQLDQFAVDVPEN